MDKYDWVFVQPLFQGKSNMYYTFLVYICSLRYSTCNGYAPYCHLWFAGLYNIFLSYLINGTIFEKNYAIQKVCFKFLYDFGLKYFSF